MFLKNSRNIESNINLFLDSKDKSRIIFLSWTVLSVIDFNGPTHKLNCQWNSSGIEDCQMLKYQSSEP